MAEDTTPTPEGRPPQETPTPPPATGDLGDAGKKALDAERDARKASDKKARELERELENLRRTSMTESERAVAEAKAAGRAEASTEFASRLVRADFLTESAKRNSTFDATTILDDLNLARYVTDDGEPDTKAIAAAVARLVPVPGDQLPVPPSLDLGHRPPGTTAGDPARDFANFIGGHLAR